MMEHVNIATLQFVKR